MATIDDAVEIYKQFASFPDLISARISRASSHDTLTVNSVWQQKDVERLDKTRISRDYVVNKVGDDYNVVSHSVPCDISTEQWNIESPSGKQRAVIRKIQNKKGEEQQFIEIWSAGRKALSLTVDKLKAHDRIYHKDDQFGSVQWAQGEGHLLYVAEKKTPKTASFFERTTGKDDDEICKGDAHVYKDVWGEQLHQQSTAVLCVLNIDTEHVSILENCPENVTPGQAVWGPDDAGVLFVGWDELPYRLGVIYCHQRPNHLYYIDLRTAECRKLQTQPGYSLFTPFFNAERTKIFYLDNKTGGAHRHCQRLLQYDWATEETTVLVDIVNSSNMEKDEFPGLYLLGLKQDCFSRDNSQILLSTVWRTREELVSVNLNSKELVRISHNCYTVEAIGSWKLQDVYEDNILVCCSSPNQPPFLMVGKLPQFDALTIKSGESSNEGVIEWRQLDKGVSKWGPNHRVVTQYITPSCVNVKYPLVGFDSVLYLPNIKDPHSLPPLIVSPHGGPHSSYIEDFSLKHSAYCMAGYAVLEVNFRGSTGYGEDSISSLLGNIGKQDVQDVQESVMKHCDKENVFVMGGSHGGFLVAHLIGQYPDFYRAASCRNPVIDLTAMFTTTDIPDWVYTECGYEFSFTSVPNDDIITTLLDKSPLKYINSVKTPLLMCVGETDLRVPPSQGLGYAKGLKARGVPVRILSYPTDHRLITVDAESDVFINTIAWFRQHHKHTPK